MSSTAVEEKKTSKSIRKKLLFIRPYVVPGTENMGLEKYDMVVHEGCDQTEQITCIEKHGIKKFITGLDEFSETITGLTDPTVKAARIKQIREKVSFLEKSLASNVIEVGDKEFWEKVKVVRPDNADFWGKFVIKGTNTSVTLDPDKAEDLIKISVIEAGGINMVAKSYEDARSRSVPPKWYLDKQEETYSTKTEVKKLRNAAIAKLQEIFTSDSAKLFYVAKCVDGDSVQYKKGTPLDVIYDNMDKFIHGAGVQKSEKKAAEAFVSACATELKDLKLKAIVLDASFYRMIILKGDGMLYHTKSSAMMGKNIAECIEFLNNPLNDKILEDLINDVEAHWKE